MVLRGGGGERSCWLLEGKSGRQRRGSPPLPRLPSPEGGLARNPPDLPRRRIDRPIMEPKPRLFKRAAASPGGGRICSPPPGLTSAPGPPCCYSGGRSPPAAAAFYCGVIAPAAACSKPPSGPAPTAPAAGNAVYTVLVEDASLRRRSRRRSCEDGGAGGGGGKSPPPGSRGRLQLLQKVNHHPQKGHERASGGSTARLCPKQRSASWVGVSRRS